MIRDYHLGFWLLPDVLTQGWLSSQKLCGLVWNTCMIGLHICINVANIKLNAAKAKKDKYIAVKYIVQLGVYKIYRYLICRYLKERKNDW